MQVFACLVSRFLNVFMDPPKTDSPFVSSKLIIKARLHSSIRNSGPVSFAISIDALTTIRAAKILILQKAQKAPGASEWNAPSSPSFFLLRFNDIVPLLNEDLPASAHLPSFQLIALNFLLIFFVSLHTFQFFCE